jgi:hypothetical protein
MRNRCQQTWSSCAGLLSCHTRYVFPIASSASENTQPAALDVMLLHQPPANHLQASMPCVLLPVKHVQKGGCSADGCQAAVATSLFLWQYAWLIPLVDQKTTVVSIGGYHAAIG